MYPLQCPRAGHGPFVLLNDGAAVARIDHLTTEVDIHGKGRPGNIGVTRKVVSSVLTARRAIRLLIHVGCIGRYRFRAMAVKRVHPCGRRHETVLAEVVRCSPGGGPRKELQGWPSSGVPQHLDDDRSVDGECAPHELPVLAARADAAGAGRIEVDLQVELLAHLVFAAARRNRLASGARGWDVERRHAGAIVGELVASAGGRRTVRVGNGHVHGAARVRRGDLRDDLVIAVYGESGGGDGAEVDGGRAGESGATDGHACTRDPVRGRNAKNYWCCHANLDPSSVNAVDQLQLIWVAGRWSVVDVDRIVVRDVDRLAVTRAVFHGLDPGRGIAADLEGCLADALDLCRHFGLRSGLTLPGGNDVRKAAVLLAAAAGREREDDHHAVVPLDRHGNVGCRRGAHLFMLLRIVYEMLWRPS